MRLLLKRDIQAVIVPISSFILLLVCLTLRDEVCAWIWIWDMRQHAKLNIDYAKTLHRFWYHFCFGFAFIMPGCFLIISFSLFFSSTHCIFHTKIQKFGIQLSSTFERWKKDAETCRRIGFRLHLFWHHSKQIFDVESLYALRVGFIQSKCTTIHFISCSHIFNMCWFFLEFSFVSILN